MPAKYPEEFRDDVVRVALHRDQEVTLAQIAKDFGIHVGTLDKWLRQARIEDGEKPGMTRSENDELRELRRRNRLLEQEAPVLRRAAAYLSQAHLPGKGSTRRARARRRRDSCCGVVPGIKALTPALLPVAEITGAGA